MVVAYDELDISAASSQGITTCSGLTQTSPKASNFDMTWPDFVQEMPFTAMEDLETGRTGPSSCEHHGPNGRLAYLQFRVDLDIAARYDARCSIDAKYIR